MSYFSLQDILATHQRLPCRVPAGSDPLRGLGFLDPSNQGNQGNSDSDSDSIQYRDLQPETKLELPVWIASALTRRARIGPDRFQVDLPDLFSLEKRVGQLRADPDVLDLPRFGQPHFYTTGRNLLRFAAASDRSRPVEVKGEEELGPVLIEVLSRRFRYILDCSFHAEESEAPTKMAKLDAWEKELYEEGQRSQRQLNNWSKRKTDKITTSDLVSRHRKRKADSLT